MKRRNVFRVAAAYAVGAWIMIEAGSVLLPTFGASENIFRIYVIVVIVGFLISLVLAWVFEWTPEGVKLDRNVDRSQPADRSTGRRLDLAIIGLLVVALGISLTLNITGLRDAGPEDAAASSRQSIAVLPFESRSTDPENELFADGIHDDLLTRLANIGSLRVISRTSVMEYRDTTKNLRQIGSELGVGTVLEGAVQRVGDNVRISAQLIDAATDRHIWAESFDRQLNAQNIFAIQSEISAEISAALKAELTTDERLRISSVPTQDIEAYRLYTRGRANVYRRRLETLLKAREQFEEATSRDPEFAEAYVGLAESVLLLFNNHQAIPREDALILASAALDTALSLDPELGEAYAVLGLLKQKDWEETRSGSGLDEAVAAYQRSIELNPNDPRAFMWFAAARTSQQRYEDAIELYREALRLDPLGRIPHANLPHLYAQLGHQDKALDAYLDAVDIHPEWPTAYQNLSLHLLGLGRFDEALAWGRRARELSTDPLAVFPLVASWVEFGDTERAWLMFADMPTDHPFYNLGDGIRRLLAEDFAAATRAFEAVIASSDSPRQFLFDLVAGSATLAGDFARARVYLERGHPGLIEDAGPQVSQFNLAAVVMYAFVLQKLGDGERAAPLLDAALSVVEELPRLGTAGHGIRDVQILALQGRSFEALASLRDAIDAGFRGTVFFNGWTLPIDPYLESIRDRPEFQGMLAEIDAAVALMRDRVLEAETSGDWSGLMALAERG